MSSNIVSFDLTPRILTNHVPVLFIPFKNNEIECNYCGNEYSKTQSEQKYCENCLISYIKYTTTDNTYLNTYIINASNERITVSIQKLCERCSEISYFKPIDLSFNYCLSAIYYHKNHYEITDSTLFQQWTLYSFEHGSDCSDCYQISSGWVKSSLTKELVPILYLPWWDSRDRCVSCWQELKYLHIENCQKWCSYCFIIYTGCRYCLMTNIIFGITKKSQCKKCKRILRINIDITNISSGNRNIDKFLASTRTFNDRNNSLIVNYMNNNTSLDPLNVYKFIKKKSYLKRPVIKWIQYSQIKNLRKIAEGGFSSVYKATLSEGTGDTDVAIKRLFNSQNISKYFLNELKSLYQCNKYKNGWVTHCHGITQDPVTQEYMLIMNYADGGNLHNYLQKNFINITWETKIHILWEISSGLRYIHKNNFIHRDIHSGNILLSKYWQIGDLGLSQPANSNSPNNGIYGVIPYVAPEIFESGEFSKKSDIYSLGMIMWELTTGCKPFADIEHDASLICKIIDGKRPVITNDTPKCFANLMKKCWDSNPLKRPSINEICNTVNKWYNLTSYKWNEWYYIFSFISSEFAEFKKAEIERMELIKLKKLGPEFSRKLHSKAIFTSRALNSLISESSTISSSSQEYISKELDIDIT
ncbi:hypothetical protein RclHR1_05820002 [Rhizophagus clarus]|uniref:Kinase-like domain-containing protein n=1 Tax=Rhizophagus clarus TaxID=94130 RepID=A0A2Z6S6B4_9GLOM|nr:hypothetical protein RclHR1_05820002 [Rhizophagus clarus]GES79333.1 kinase-like domain-containing protein [Rhizophagus clarus]